MDHGLELIIGILEILEIEVFIFPIILEILEISIFQFLISWKYWKSQFSYFLIILKTFFNGGPGGAGGRGGGAAEPAAGSGAEPPGGGAGGQGSGPGGAEVWRAGGGTGVHAVAEAGRSIGSGEADVMLAGGAEACIEPLAVAGFTRLRALSTSFNEAPADASRPFDARRDGFVIGEGAAVLLLEAAEHASARDAVPLAELRAVGLSSDAHHITAPSEGGAGALRAMRAALRAGGVGVDELDYINAHATSTPTGDLAEALAIEALAAGRSATAAPLRVSSAKGATGHLLGAAGAVEAAYTVRRSPKYLVPARPRASSTLTRGP